MHVSATEVDAKDLISKLAQPVPTSIAFKELRFSPLLDHPSVVSGRLSYLGPESLDRLVTQPYREKTLIRGESVRVEREGEKLRTFALKRAPELRGLLTAFSAMLAGDAAAVERNFELSATGASGQWEISLTPRDERARKRLRELTMTGRQNQPECFSLAGGDGTQSIMLLGESASHSVDAITEPAQLMERCRSNPLQE
jgi:hypothetical protein